MGRQLRHKSAIHLPVPCSDLEVLVPRSTNAFRAMAVWATFTAELPCRSWSYRLSARVGPKRSKDPGGVRPVEQIVTLSQNIEVSPGYGDLLDALDETRLPRHVEIKVLDTATGMLVFRSEQAATVRPGENVVLKLRRIPEAKTSLGQELELKTHRRGQRGDLGTQGSHPESGTR